MCVLGAVTTRIMTSMFRRSADRQDSLDTTAPLKTRRSLLRAIVINQEVNANEHLQQLQHISRLARSSKGIEKWFNVGANLELGPGVKPPPVNNRKRRSSEQIVKWFNAGANLELGGGKKRPPVNNRKRRSKGIVKWFSGAANTELGPANAIATPTPAAGQQSQNTE